MNALYAYYILYSTKAAVIHGTKCTLSGTEYRSHIKPEIKISTFHVDQLLRQTPRIGMYAGNGAINT